MKITNKNSNEKIYLIIFYLSFLILTLQVILSSLLRVYLKLPFFSITFAFLGLTSAGIYSYLVLDKQPEHELDAKLPFYLIAFGLLFLLYFTLIFKANVSWYNIFVEKIIKENPQYDYAELLVHVLHELFKNTIFSGFCFSACFFFLGLSVSSIYKFYSNNAPRLYLFDLIGASVGCVLGTCLISIVRFSYLPILISMLTFVVAFIISSKDKKAMISKYSALLLFAISAYIIYLNYTSNILELETKNKYITKSGKGEIETQVVWSRWNPYSRVALVKRQTIIEGKKLNPRYIFNIDNGMGMAKLIPFNAENPFAKQLFEEFDPVSLAFLLSQPDDLLIMLAGAGRDMLDAYSYSKGQSNITGVEINPLIVNKAINFSEFNLSSFFNKDNITIVTQEGRSFLEADHESYDSIIYSWAGASICNYLGLSAYTAQYLHTKEAFISALAHLKPSGTIGLVNGNKLKLTIIFKAAFNQLGYSNFDKSIIVIFKKDALDNETNVNRFLNPIDFGAILVKKDGFSKSELKKIEKRLALMNMKLVYSPEATHPDYKVFEEIAKSGDLNKTIKKYMSRFLIDLSISSDDNPFAENLFYIGNILKKEFWNIHDNLKATRHAYHYLMNLYTILLICFVLLVGFIFVFLPLIIKRRNISIKRDLLILYYFAILGFGFFLVEISILNQFTLFLGNPAYSFALVLALFLTSAGIGSYFSNYLFKNNILNLKKMSIIAPIVLLFYFFFLSKIIHMFLGVAFFYKALISVIIISPMGICLGMFFPQGLKKLYKNKKDMIPWAWGMNGYMSIVGSSFSIYFSTITGFSWFILLAAVLYLTLFFVIID